MVRPVITPAKLEDLVTLLKQFDELLPKAKANPGRLLQGNRLLQQDEEQYYPSKEELALAELGRKIEFIVKHSEKEVVRKYLETHTITRKSIMFNDFSFDGHKVMGSGRMVNYSNPVKKVVEFP